MEKMLTVVRVKRFEHGFALLTMVRLTSGSLKDGAVFYAVYHGIAFCFASTSLNRTFNHLRELNCVFDTALHVGEDERIQMVSKIAEIELINRQLQIDYNVYQGAVSRHESEIESALQRDKQARVKLVQRA